MEDRSKQTSSDARPRQAVILAGGRGTRMSPLTDIRPKPMIEVGGRPFLDRLLLQLRDQGFHEVLLLLGYRAKSIQHHVGNGSRFGLKVSYSVQDESCDTGLRLSLAKNDIHGEFLLAYCDNYWPMNFGKMFKSYSRGNTLAQVVVYRNKDAYTRDNIQVTDDGLVGVYDKTRTAAGLAGVDIGFLIAQRRVLDLLPNENVSFEKTVYPRLIEQRQLCAYETDHRYYSIGSLRRLAETERFFCGPPTVLVDRDGVLNQRMPKAEYVDRWEKWSWFPGSLEALRMLTVSGYRIVVISNQAGIARGVMTRQQLDEIHSRMIDDVAAAGGYIHAVYVCPHGWDENCECRKPRPGMLLNAQRDFALDLSNTTFFGDDERDKIAADAASCKFVEINERTTFFSAVQALLSERTLRLIA